MKRNKFSVISVLFLLAAGLIVVYWIGMAEEKREQAVFVTKPVHLKKTKPAVETISNSYFHFYNVTDYPPALPFMSIYFDGIPDRNIDKADKLRKLIDKSIRDGGGIVEEKDYEKLTSIITKHTPEMVGYDAGSIRIDFPRRKEGMILHQEK